MSAFKIDKWVRYMYLKIPSIENCDASRSHGHLPQRRSSSGDPYSRVLAVIDMFNGNQKIFASIWNDAIIFSVLLASNTTLYLASRTLYDMALRVKDPAILKRLIHALSTVDSKTGVPIYALFLAWAKFFWIPFMSLKNFYQVQHLNTSSELSLQNWLTFPSDH